MIALKGDASMIFVCMPAAYDQNTSPTPKSRARKFKHVSGVAQGENNIDSKDIAMSAEYVHVNLRSVSEQLLFTAYNRSLTRKQEPVEQTPEV